MIWAKSLKIPAQEKMEFLHSYFPGFCLDFKQFAVVLSKSQNFFFASMPSNDRFRSDQDFAWISSNLLLFFQNPKTFFLRKCLRMTAAVAMGKKLQTGIVCRGVKKARPHYLLPTHFQNFVNPLSSRHLSLSLMSPNTLLQFV